jgi:hypothetical protein
MVGKQETQGCFALPTDLPYFSIFKVEIQQG